MSNPLTDYYRTKEIYVKLPTGGQWYKNQLHLTDNGEIGVMPMSFKDEMLLQIPDSIYNGESLFEILRSILPDMTDPYEICMPDVDVVLLASRINSNDGDVPATATCPHCNHTEQYFLKIVNILNKVTAIEPLTVELASGLTVEFKPNTLRAVASNQIKITENARMIAQLAEAPSGEAQTQEMFKQSLERSTAANLVIIADTIQSISTPAGDQVTDINSILEWLQNSDSSTIKQLQKHGRNMNLNGLDNQFEFQCGSETCGETFSTQVEFNPTFFFTNKS